MKNIFRHLILISSVLLCFTSICLTQEDDQGLRDMIDDLRDFVALPNNGLNRSDIEKNLTWLKDVFKKMDMVGKVLATEGNPLFFAEKIIDKDLPTVLFYMHVDGQPVDPSKWDQENPYNVVLKHQFNQRWEPIDWKNLDGPIDRDWRLFGRSAADDKAPIIAFIHAYRQMKARSLLPALNIKVIIDAEEEMGSQSLPAAVDQYKDLLAADVLIINDGPVHISGKPTLIFGCRGNMRVDLTVYGPALPQHSGHFGNYAPNPVFRLAHLLSSMKDKLGRVTIDGYYDGINISEADQEILNAVPDNETQIRDLLQIAEPEQVGRNYQASLQYPSLNARGLASGWVGNQARTIVPDHATVAIDIRLVPESNPDSLVNKIKRHIRSEGFHIVDHEPTKEERLAHAKIVFLNYGQATLPFRTEMNSKEGIWLAQTLLKQYGETPIKIRMMGGTVPIASFVTKMQIPAIIVPMVNADNNQHSPNENMRLGHLQNAKEIFLAILTTPLP